MFGIIEKALLIGKGLEERATKMMDDLAKEGEKKAADLPTSKEEFENKLVEGGTKIAGEAINHLKQDKEKIEKKISQMMDRLFEKFKVVTRDDIEVIEKMAARAREKVDELEKRIELIEKKEKE
jgi:BMFP domain-containing protein YqiC